MIRHQKSIRLHFLGAHYFNFSSSLGNFLYGQFYNSQKIGCEPFLAASTQNLKQWDLTNYLGFCDNRIMCWGPSIKDVGIFQGGRGVSNSDVARYQKVKVRLIRVKIPTWGRGVSKTAQKIPTSFMDGPLFYFLRIIYLLNKGIVIAKNLNTF